jgi:HD-GYP domain-containing protein (c-di-GMP phosphodiesterase class II)
MMAIAEHSRVTVRVDRLQPGWQVDREIMADQTVLVTAGTTITQRMIDAFHRRGIEQVEISRDSTLIKLLGADDEAARNLAETYARHRIEQAIPPEVIEELTDEIESFFAEIELGQEIDYSKMRGIVHQMVELFKERSNYAVKLVDLDRFDRYTYRHSLNVGMLMMLVASDWVDSQEELEDIVFGSVLHDAGKARVGHQIINKPGKLTDEEWAIMRQHPIWSEEIMRDAAASPQAISIARSHHERLDGRGYPDGLNSDKLNRYVRLSTICDVYDALTTKRSYKQKMSYAKAIDIILQSCGTQFDPAIAHEFIRRVGRYPIGTFVRLSSNEVAVIIGVNQRALSCPIVSRVLSADGAFTEQAEELDLARQHKLFITEILVGAQAAS